MITDKSLKKDHRKDKTKNKLYKMPKKRNNKKKKKTLQQIKEYLNDKSLYIKRVSRDFFMGTDIGTRKHKDKTKYNRKIKHKKGFRDEY